MFLTSAPASIELVDDGYVGSMIKSWIGFSNFVACALSVLITLKAFTLADYSQTEGLDLVMVRFSCSQVQGANKSIWSPPWYCKDALIATSAARLIKASGFVCMLPIQRF